MWLYHSWQWKNAMNRNQPNIWNAKFPLKDSSTQWGLTPFPLSGGQVSPTGMAVTSPLHPFCFPVPSLMPIAYGKDWPIWLLPQKRWIRQENMPKHHQAMRKHEQVRSWCCPGCCHGALAVQGRPAPRLLTALCYLPWHPSHWLILLGSASDSVY